MRIFSLSAAVVLSFSAMAPQLAAESLPFARLSDICGPFEGTGVRGDAFYRHRLGRVGKWTICAYWSSMNRGYSPFLGRGWCIPALESTFVQIDERRWLFRQPDGYERIFVVSAKKGKNMLNGGPAWKADVEGDRISVVADPGDGGIPSKFEFLYGRLIRMSCEEGEFLIKYSGRVASQIVSKGKILLNVERKSQPEAQTVFQFGEYQRITASLKPASVVEYDEEGVSSTVTMRPALASFVTGGKKTVFSHSIVGTTGTFTCGRQTMTWDVGTGFIRSLNDWSYEIEMKEDGGEEPSYCRRHSDGRREIYHYNRTDGVLSRHYADGSARIRQMFTSGPLAYRRVRWNRTVNPDGTCRQTDYSYDGDGRLYYSRTTDNEKGDETKVECWYNPSGTVKKRRVDGVEVGVK